ncbi:2Fe-2S iron-sulfur cluster-binding protein [Diaphorobacter aerolatus]|uniref:2Fe-2S iron-sulfur cluster binding domain-containing protein n=1 Tax=Diaphorobacter aerolatus TaxID=1288495 RepID=A0A7H0GM00_9BURK|nr:2Fe-2S iron-sulfur cluster-binding protein [Diaphorobacter aerolatus]QNP49316.1 2Fe-2S iron-sulfur cluster binding domain-containing protein [Diaphorobacter aerolatus]
MSYTIEYEGHVVESRDDETVLDTLLRSGVDIAFSCKGGSCHTCLMQCQTGSTTEPSRRSLPEYLQRLRYFLPCRCIPQSAMKLRRPQPGDLVTNCMLCESILLDDGRVSLLIEPMRTLNYRQGQRLQIVTGQAQEPAAQITSNSDRDVIMAVVLAAAEAAKLPESLQPGAEFGIELQVRGPFDERPPEELPYPEPDPGLWELLDGGVTARRVLEAFYVKVYADPVLAPFFQGVTKSRAIDKQFSFMKQCITGEKIYMGDRPRNAHHWMIITHEVFDRRQALMQETWREHGVADEVIARWVSIEEYFRPDIVKTYGWPRQVGDQLIHNDGFSREMLGESTLCDHCQQEVLAGETVLMHRRLGTISCKHCASSAA